VNLACLRALVHHDDAGHEVACDEGAEKAVAAADAPGWTVVSIKEGFPKAF
jgi:hypothetical protein